MSNYVFTARRTYRKLHRWILPVVVWALVIGAAATIGVLLYHAAQVDRSKCVIHYVDGHITTVLEGRIIYDSQDLICRADV